jgi:hypothetical protein
LWLPSSSSLSQYVPESKARRCHATACGALYGTSYIYIWY